MNLAPLATVVGPMLFGFHSPSPSILMHVLSIRRCNPVVVGCAAIITERCFWRRLTVLKSGTCQIQAIELEQALRHTHHLAQGQIEQALDR